MSTPFALHETARLRNPLSPAEGRLATIVNIEPRPDDPDGDRYRLRFPGGHECDVYATKMRRPSRDADRRAIITALSAATDRLRKACLIAHDYDNEALNAQILSAFAQIVGAARTHLDIDLHPPRSREANDTEADGGPR